VPFHNRLVSKAFFCYFIIFFLIIKWTNKQFSILKNIKYYLISLCMTLPSIWDTCASQAARVESFCGQKQPIIVLSKRSRSGASYEMTRVQLFAVVQQRLSLFYPKFSLLSSRIALAKIKFKVSSHFVFISIVVLIFLLFFICFESLFDWFSFNFIH